MVVAADARFRLLRSLARSEIARSIVLASRPLDADASSSVSSTPRVPSRQAIFVADDVNEIIKESIDAVLQNAAYSHAKVGQWTSSAVETTLRRLTALKKPFKYVVTCVIMQKNGAGLHTASSCYWDNETDGASSLRVANASSSFVARAADARGGGGDVLDSFLDSPVPVPVPVPVPALTFAPPLWYSLVCRRTGSRTVRWENKSMYCIVTVFGLAV